MIFGTGTAILVGAYPQEERGRALGINVAATYLGLTLGPFLGGILTGSLGWRSVFLVNVPVGLLVLALALFVIEERGDGRKVEKMDLPGAGIYSMSLVAIMYGFSRISTPAGIWLALAGSAGLALFVYREKRVESPVLDIHLLTNNRQFAFSNLATFIHYSATFAVTFLMSLYLQEVKGMTPQAAGLILVSQPFIMMAFSPLAGRLSDRIEPRLLASAGMGVTCAGLALLAFLHSGSNLLSILVPLVIIGLGFAFFSSPNTNAVMSSVPKRTYGTASGMIATMRLTGQTTSMGIVLLLFAVCIGQGRIAPEAHGGFMTSMRVCCGVFSVLCAAGAVASLARGSMRENGG
jgi:MFS family permease